MHKGGSRCSTRTLAAPISTLRFRSTEPTAAPRPRGSESRPHHARRSDRGIPPAPARRPEGRPRHRRRQAVCPRGRRQCRHESVCHRVPCRRYDVISAVRRARRTGEGVAVPSRARGVRHHDAERERRRDDRRDAQGARAAPDADHAALREGGRAAVIRLLDDGAQDFVVKPFSEKDLLVRVRNLILAEEARVEDEPTSARPPKAPIRPRTSSSRCWATS